MSRQIIIRMPDDLHAQLAADSEQQERTISQTVRLAVKQYLARHRETPS